MKKNKTSFVFPDFFRWEKQNLLCCRWFFVVVMCLSFSSGAFAQQQKVSISVKNVDVSVVFRHIKEQTKLNFVYDPDQLVSMSSVTMDVRNVSVDSVLSKLFAGTSFEYRFEMGSILIRKIPRKQEQEQMVVQGTVYDVSKQVLPGVTVMLKGTTVGTATDMQGRYQMVIPKTDKPVLVFSFIGMKNAERSFNGEKSLNVTLEEEAENLDEVVVTGLVTHNAKSFTGNASVYNSEDLKAVGHQNLIKSLALLDPSLSIAENIEMGSDPNTMPKIRFRGESSFQGFESIDKSGLVNDPNQPLFILDGYQTTLEKIVDLDMNRVESVTILKDAAAGAIYGSRAANGVIVVKTIQPKSGELQISYSMDLDFNLPDLSSYDLLNAKENLQLINRLGLYRNNDGTLAPGYNEIARWVAEGVDTDWLSQPVRNAVGHKHSLNLSGGDNRMRYGVDLNYSGNPGVMKKSSRTNYGIGVNLSYNYNDRLLFSNYLSVGVTKSKESPCGNFSDYTTINSFYPIYDEKGDLYKSYYFVDQYGNLSNLWGSVNNEPSNPLYEAFVGNKDESTSSNVNENFSFDWLIHSSLRLNGRISYTKNQNETTSFLSPNSVTYKDYGEGMSDVTTEDEILRGRYTYSQVKQEALEGNLLVTWSRNIGKHFATASAGVSMSDTRSVVYGFTAQGFGGNDASEPAYAEGYEEGGVPNNSEGHTRLASFFASANYAFDSRYLFDFSYRLDGSSQFGSEENVAPFYSVGLGWNVHNETFVRKLNFVNMLKLRATYGELGSISFSPYQAKDIYTATKNDRYDGNIGVVLQGLGNENLRWQTTKSYDFGLTLGLFDRFDFSLSFYKKETHDMVLPVTTPPSVGFDSFTENLGRMRNTGYELSLRAFAMKKKTLNVSVFLNASHNKNKILSISSALESYNKSIDTSEGKTESEYKQASHKFLTKYEEGQSTTAIYAVRSLGIDPMTGEELFLTKEGKPTWTWNALDKVVVGDTELKIRGTFGVNAGWKGLYMNATFAYQYGGEAYNQTVVDKVENSNKYQNVDKRVLTETWQKPGDIVKYKANVTSRLVQYFTYASSRFVQDLNYLQFSSFSLQYEMPKNWISCLRMESLRFSFNMSDLFYWSTVKRERGTSYPFARSFTVGLRANF